MDELPTIHVSFVVTVRLGARSVAATFNLPATPVGLHEPTAASLTIPPASVFLEQPENLFATPFLERRRDPSSTETDG